MNEIQKYVIKSIEIANNVKTTQEVVLEVVEKFWNKDEILTSKWKDFIHQDKYKNNFLSTLKQQKEDFKNDLIEKLNQRELEDFVTEDCEVVEGNIKLKSLEIKLQKELEKKLELEKQQLEIKQASKEVEESIVEEIQEVVEEELVNEVSNEEVQIQEDTEVAEKEQEQIIQNIEENKEELKQEEVLVSDTEEELEDTEVQQLQTEEETAEMEEEPEPTEPITNTDTDPLLEDIVEEGDFETLLDISNDLIKKEEDFKQEVQQVGSLVKKIEKEVTGQEITSILNEVETKTEVLIEDQEALKELLKEETEKIKEVTEYIEENIKQEKTGTIEVIENNGDLDIGKEVINQVKLSLEETTKIIESIEEQKSQDKVCPVLEEKEDVLVVEVKKEEEKKLDLTGIEEYIASTPIPQKLVSEVAMERFGLVDSSKKKLETVITKSDIVKKQPQGKTININEINKQEDIDLTYLIDQMGWEVSLTKKFEETNWDFPDYYLVSYLTGDFEAISINLVDKKNKIKEKFFKTVSNTDISNKSYLIIEEKVLDFKTNVEVMKLGEKFNIGIIVKNENNYSLGLEVSNKSLIDDKIVDELISKNEGEFKRLFKVIRKKIKSGK